MTEKKYDPFAVLRIKDFRFYISARLFLTIAVNFQAVCVGWQIYDLTKDPLSLGLIGLAEAIPYVLIALYAGYIVDHFNRKKILFTAVSALIISSSLLFYFSLNSSHMVEKFGTLPVYALIFVTGLARGFVSPSMFAMMTQIVPRNLYGNSSTWNSTVWQIGAVSGPALGGLLYGFYGVSNAYATNIFFFLFSLIFFLSIPVKPHIRPEKKEKISQSISAGLKFVFSNQIMLSALSLDLFAVFFGGAVALLPIFADQILHVGPEGLGMLRSAPALGACIMAVILAFNPIKENAGKILLVSVAIFGLTTIVFALSENFYLSLFVLALGGAFDNISVVVRTTIVQLMTPDDMRGRVSSVNSIFIGSSNEIGAFESGFAAKLLGLIPSVIFGGTMTMAVVAITARFAPRLRKLNLEHE
jgi:MFS family permease